MPDLSLIIPSYAEEENLRLLIPRIKEACTRVADSYEILVVDTMEPMDGTPLLCEQEGVRYLPRLGGNRYGDAVRTGIKKSSGDHVIFMDADGSHPPHFLSELYERRNDADVIVASRYVSGGHTENSKVLIMMSLMVNIGFRIVLGLKCKDVSNSFKLYRGDAIRSLKLKCHNFDIVEEILVRLARADRKLSILEVPFHFKQRMFGKTKRSLSAFVLSYFVTLVKLRFSR